MENAFERFVRMVTEEKVHEDASITFVELCRRLRCCPDDLNDLLLEQCGLDGDGVLDACRLWE